MTVGRAAIAGSKARLGLGELFYYCIALLTLETDKARPAETTPGEGGMICTFESSAGERFNVARPAMNEDVEA